MNCRIIGHLNSLIICICLDKNCHHTPLSCHYCVEVFHQRHKLSCQRFRNLAQLINQKQKELHQLKLTGLKKQINQSSLEGLYKLIINKNYDQLCQHLNLLKTLFPQSQQQSKNTQLLNSFNNKREIQYIQTAPKKKVKIEIKHSAEKQTDYVLLEREAFQLYAKKDYKKALKQFNKLIKFDKTKHILHLYQSETLLKLNKCKKAITSIKKAIKYCNNDANNAHHFTVLASALFRLHKKQKSLKALDQAIQLNPQYSNAYVSKSYILKSLNRRVEAINLLQVSIQKNPNHFNSWMLTGEYLFQSSKFEESLNSFNKAIDINPNVSRTYYFKSWLLFKQQKYLESLDMIEKCLKLKPNYVDYLNVKSVILLKLNRIPEARYFTKKLQGFTNLLKQKK